jgi:hypothetical protein
MSLILTTCSAFKKAIHAHTFVQHLFPCLRETTCERSGSGAVQRCFMTFHPPPTCRLCRCAVRHKAAPSNDRPPSHHRPAANNNETFADKFLPSVSLHCVVDTHDCVLINFTTVKQCVKAIVDTGLSGTGEKGCNFIVFSSDIEAGGESEFLLFTTDCTNMSTALKCRNGVGLNELFVL